MIYAHEQLSRWFMEAQSLFRRHWEEIASDKDVIALDPDWHKMLKAEEIGMADGFTARSATGQLCGYAWFLVSAHLHYRQDRFAYCDLFYIVPECRGPRVSQRLVECAEAYFAAAKVAKIQYHFKLKHDRVGRLFASLGYVARETIYEKTLKGRGIEEQPRRLTAAAGAN